MRSLMVPLDIRLDAFYVRKLKTNIKINEAIIKTLHELTSLMECGVISDQDFIDLGKELWMSS